MSRLLEHIIRKFLFEQDPPSEEERRQDYDERFKVIRDPKETEAKVQLFSGTEKQKSAAKKLGAEQVLLVKVTYSTDAVVNPIRIYDIVEDAIAIDFKSNDAVQPYASEKYYFVIGNPSDAPEQYIPVIIISKETVNTYINKEKHKKLGKYEIRARQRYIQNLSYIELAEDPTDPDKGHGQVLMFMNFLLENNDFYLNKIKQAIAENFFDVPASESYLDYTNAGNKEKYNTELSFTLYLLETAIKKTQRAKGLPNDILANISFKDISFIILQLLWEPDKISNLSNEYKKAIQGKEIRKKFSEKNAKNWSVAINLHSGGLFRNDMDGGKFLSLLDLIEQLKANNANIPQLNAFVNKKGFMNSSWQALSSLYFVKYMINSNNSLMLNILKDLKLKLPKEKQITVPKNQVDLYKKLPIIYDIIFKYDKLPADKQQNYNVDVNTLKDMPLAGPTGLTQLRQKIIDSLTISKINK